MEIETFYIDGREVDQSEFEAELRDAFEERFEEDYAEYFDECYSQVEIMGLTFKASKIVSELDPLAYRTTMLDDADSEFRDYIDEVYRNTSWEETINNTEFRYEWELTEDEESEDKGTMKPLATMMHYDYSMGLFDAALIIRALECYAEHAEGHDASDALKEAEYIKQLGDYNEEAGIMRGFYTEG